MNITVLAARAEKNGLKENGCVKHMLQITLSGKSTEGAGGASPCTRSAVRCLSVRTRRPGSRPATVLALLLAFREGVLRAALAWDTTRPTFGQCHPMEEQIIRHPAARGDSGRP